MKVKYTGVRPKGTLRPRRMWSPGEVLELEDGLAEDLAGERDFEILRKPRSRRSKETRANKTEEKEPEEKAEK